MIKKVILTTIALLSVTTAMAQVPPPPVYPSHDREQRQWQHQEHQADWNHLQEARNRLAHDEQRYQELIRQQQWAQEHGDYPRAEHLHQEALEFYGKLEAQKHEVHELEQKVRFEHRD